MQLYSRIYDYIHEYQELVYDVYSKDAIAFLVTYYHINITETNWDDTWLDGGSYEDIGELSGQRWDKLLLLPVYYIEEVSTAFEGREEGYVKQTESSIVIPSSYGIQPYPRDAVKFEQSYLRPTNDIYPLYLVSGIEKSANTDKTFWRLKLKVDASTTTDMIDSQVNETFSFVEYVKKIYSISDASLITKLALKNEQIRDRLSLLFDQNSGFYFV